MSSKTHRIASRIIQLARTIASAKPCTISQGWGPQRHANGENTARAIFLLHSANFLACELCQQVQALALALREADPQLPVVFLRLNETSVSQALSQLEREVGVPLVEKVGRRLRLTPAAEVLVEQATSRFKETREWAFKHALTREVAYASLGEEQLKELHTAAGLWLAKMAEDDSIVDIKTTREFAKLLQQHNQNVTVQTVPTGDHYESMINQGIPAGVEWIKQQR